MFLSFEWLLILFVSSTLYWFIWGRQNEKLDKQILARRYNIGRRMEALGYENPYVDDDFDDYDDFID